MDKDDVRVMPRQVLFPQWIMGLSMNTFLSQREFFCGIVDCIHLFRNHNSCYRYSFFGLIMLVNEQESTTN